MVNFNSIISTYDRVKSVAKEIENVELNELLVELRTALYREKEKVLELEAQVKHLQALNEKKKERKVVRYLGAAYCCDESGDPYGKAICPDCYINNQKISTLSDERPNRKCGSCSTKFNYFDTPLISDYSDIKARLKRLKKEMIPVVL